MQRGFQTASPSVGHDVRTENCLRNGNCFQTPVHRDHQMVSPPLSNPLPSSDRRWLEKIRRPVAGSGRARPVSCLVVCLKPGQFGWCQATLQCHSVKVAREVTSGPADGMPGPRELLHRHRGVVRLDIACLCVKKTCGRERAARASSLSHRFYKPISNPTYSCE